jgi:glutaredoxin 3
MKAVQIYGKTQCPHTRRARALLDSKGIAYDWFDVERPPERMDEMIERSSGCETVPGIFIHGRHIGGADELFELDASGELDRLLGYSAEANA